MSFFRKNFVAPTPKFQKALPSLPLPSGSKVAFLGDDYTQRGGEAKYTGNVLQGMSTFGRGLWGMVAAMDSRFKIDAFPLDNKPYPVSPDQKLDGAVHGLYGDGLISTDILPGYAARLRHVLNRNPAIIVLETAAFNNIQNGITADRIIYLLDKLFAQIRDAGVYVMAVTMPDWFANSPDKRTVAATVNSWLISQAGRSGYFLANTLSLEGTDLTNYTWLPDGNHRSVYATWSVAKNAVIPALQALVSPGSRYNTDPLSTNQFLKKGTPGTAGTKSVAAGNASDITGNVATGMNLHRLTGTSTIAASKEAVATGNEKQVIVVTPVSDGLPIHSLTYRDDTAGDILLTDMGFNPSVDWGMEVLWQIELDNWEGWNTQDAQDGPAGFVVYAIDGVSYTQAINSATYRNGVYTLRSFIKFQKGRTPTALRIGRLGSPFQLRWKSTASGTGTAKMGSPIIRKLATSPANEWNLVDTDPARWTEDYNYYFVGNRTSTPVSTQALATGIYHQVRAYLGFLPEGLNSFRAAMPAHYSIVGDDKYAMPNKITIERQAIGLSATADPTAATWVQAAVKNGQEDVLLDPAVNSVGILTDDILATIPSGGRHVWYEFSYIGELNGVVPKAIDFRPLETIEGNTTHTTTTRKTLVGTGNALTVSAGGGSDYFPSYIISKGHDGREVYLAWGDSLGRGENDTNYGADQGRTGYIQRGLADTTSTRQVSCANFCVSGSSPAAWVTRGRQAVAPMLDLIKLAPNVPFSHVLHEGGTNAAATEGWNTVDGFQTNMEFLLQNCISVEWPDAPIIQGAITFKALSTKDGWQTALGQTARTGFEAAGFISLFNEALLSGRVKGASGYFDIRPYMMDPNGVYAWDVNPFRTVIAANYTAGSSTIVLRDPVEAGESILLAPDTDGTGGISRIVRDISGTGPYTCTLVNPFTYSKSVGEEVTSPNNDAAGTHPNRRKHIAARQAMVDLKNRTASGRIPELKTLTLSSTNFLVEATPGDTLSIINNKHPRSLVTLSSKDDLGLILNGDKIVFGLNFTAFGEVRFSLIEALPEAPKAPKVTQFVITIRRPIPALPLAANAKVMGFGHSFIQRAGWGILVGGKARDISSSNIRGALPWIRMWDNRFNLDIWHDLNNKLSSDSYLNGAYQGVGGDHLVAEWGAPGTINRTPTIVSLRPDIVYLDIGTNDISSAPDASIDLLVWRLNKQISLLTDAGIWVVIQTITDRGSWPIGDPKQLIVAGVNEWIKAQSSRPGVKVNDLTAKGFNYPSYDQTLFGTDILHPNPKGGRAMAVSLLPILQSMVQSGDHTDLSDNATVFNASNLFADAAFAATSAVASTGASGTRVSTLTFSRQSGGDSTAVCSVEDAGTYKKQVIQFQPSGNQVATSEEWRILKTGADPTLAQMGITPGVDWIEAGIYVEMDQWDGWASLTWQLEINATSGQAYIARSGLNNPDDPTQKIYLPGGFSGWFIIPPFQIPADVDAQKWRATSRPFVINFDRRVPGSPTIKISKPFIRKVSDPRPAWSPVPQPIIHLSSTTVSESAPVDTVVADISVLNHTEPYTYAEVADIDNKFYIQGSQLLLANLLDYETKTAHSVTIRATNGDGLSVLRTFSIGVVNLVEGTLGPNTSAYDLSDPTGTLLFQVTGLDAGANETLTSLTPNDGQFVIANGNQIVKGATVSSTGTVNLVVTTSTGRTLGNTVTITDNSVPPGPHAWSPLDLPAETPAIVWFDAAESDTITLDSVDPTKMVSWASRVGPNVAAFTAGKPGYFATGRNGLPCIRSLNADAVPLSLNHPELLPGGNSEGWIIGVAYLSNVSGTARNLFRYGTAVNTQDRAIGTGATGLPTAIIGGGGGPASAISWLNATRMVVTEFYDNNQITQSVDGTERVTTTVTYNTVATRARIGGSAGVNAPSYWDGDIQEVLVGSGQLSTADRNRFEGYLAWKWGLQSQLPSNHPYKNEMPYAGEVPTSNTAVAVPQNYQNGAAIHQVSPISGTVSQYSVPVNSGLAVDSGGLVTITDRSIALAGLPKTVDVTLTKTDSTLEKATLSLSAISDYIDLSVYNANIGLWMDALDNRFLQISGDGLTVTEIADKVDPLRKARNDQYPDRRPTLAPSPVNASRDAIHFVPPNDTAVYGLFFQDSPIYEGLQRIALASTSINLREDLDYKPNTPGQSGSTNGDFPWIAHTLTAGQPTLLTLVHSKANGTVSFYKNGTLLGSISSWVYRKTQPNTFRHDFVSLALFYPDTVTGQLISNAALGQGYTWKQAAYKGWFCEVVTFLGATLSA